MEVFLHSLVVLFPLHQRHIAGAFRVSAYLRPYQSGFPTIAVQDVVRDDDIVRPRFTHHPRVWIAFFINEIAPGVKDTSIFEIKIFRAAIVTGVPFYEQLLASRLVHVGLASVRICDLAAMGPAPTSPGVTERPHRIREIRFDSAYRASLRAAPRFRINNCSPGSTGPATIALPTICRYCLRYFRVSGWRWKSAQSVDKR